MTEGQSGGLLIMTLVIVVMFVVMFVALSGVLNRTYHESVVQANNEIAFQLAEAGLNYGRWRLAHNPDYLVAETKAVADPWAGVLGEYEVSFERAGSSSVVTVTSEGRTDALFSKTVTLQARYGQPSLASYSAIYNDDYWFGEGDVIQGAVHSNGGIRMDGVSNSIMTSARETYKCRTVHGCSNETKPGIWGSGQIQELWEYPTAAVDYNGLTVDLVNMRQAAVDGGSYYDDSGAYGYHAVLNDDDSYSVYTVDTLTPAVESWAVDDKWKSLSHDIATETLLGTYPIPEDGIIYFEDQLWVEGNVRSPVTVAAGVFPDKSSTNVDIIINGSITYDGVNDGSRVLGVISQRDILIPWSSAEDNLQMDGAYVAQKGAFGRRHYPNSGDTAVHSIKNSLSLYGMVAMNELSVDVTWVDGTTIISGYRVVERTYDSNLLYNPPPYFPTSGQYEFLSWEELD